MKYSKIGGLAAGLCVAAFAIGCTEVPQWEIQTAQAALDAAKKAEADRFAKEQYSAAQDSLHAAMDEIDRQESKAALTKNYDEAIRLLEAAAAAANHAAEAAKLQKEKVRARARDLITQAQAAINVDKERLRKLPKRKEMSSALEAIQDGIATVEYSLAQADSAMQQGDFLSARYQAKVCLDNANTIGEELQNRTIERKVALPAKSSN